MPKKHVFRYSRVGTLPANSLVYLKISIPVQLKQYKILDKRLFCWITLIFQCKYWRFKEIIVLTCLLKLLKKTLRVVKLLLMAIHVLQKQVDQVSEHFKHSFDFHGITLKKGENDLLSLVLVLAPRLSNHVSNTLTSNGVPSLSGRYYTFCYILTAKSAIISSV